MDARALSSREGRLSAARLHESCARRWLRRCRLRGTRRGGVRRAVQRACSWEKGAGGRPPPVVRCTVGPTAAAPNAHVPPPRLAQPPCARPCIARAYGICREADEKVRTLRSGCPAERLGLDRARLRMPSELAKGRSRCDRRPCASDGIDRRGHERQRERERTLEVSGGGEQIRGEPESQIRAGIRGGCAERRPEAFPSVGGG